MVSGRFRTGSHVSCPFPRLLPPSAYLLPLLSKNLHPKRGMCLSAQYYLGGPGPPWWLAAEIIFLLKERSGGTVTLHSQGQLTNSRFLLESKADKGKGNKGEYGDWTPVWYGDIKQAWEYRSQIAPFHPPKVSPPSSSAHQNLTPIAYNAPWWATAFIFQWT